MTERGADQRAIYLEGEPVDGHAVDFARLCTRAELWAAIQHYAKSQAAWERVYEQAASSPEAVYDAGLRLDEAHRCVRALLGMEAE